MLKTELADIITVYQKAREDFKTLVGDTPENYRVLLFLNPEIHISVNRVLESSGTPVAILSAEEITHLRSARFSEFMPIGKETTFNSLPTLIYLSVPNYELSNKQKYTLRVMLVHSFAHAYMNEKSSSNSAQTLAKLYQFDIILKELFQNNAYRLNDLSEKKHMWAWQYYQDLVAVIRLFTEAGIEDFYQPPEDARKYTLFNNFSIEAINVLKERANVARKKHLHDFVEEGFAFYIQRKHIEYLKESKEYSPKEHPKELKGYMAPPIGVISLFLVDKLAVKLQDEKELFEKLFSFKTDLEFFENFTWNEFKDWLSTQKNFHSETVVDSWHTTKSHYTDIWSIYAYGWNLIDNYIKKTYRKKYGTFGQLLDDNPRISSKGYVNADEKKVYVFEVNDHGIGLDQLVILHNHMVLYREDFRTILPAFADIITIKKIGGMHVATLFAVHKIGKQQPLSPYNLPVVTRAVQVSKRKEAYISDLDEEKEQIVVENIDYTYLKKLTQPQRGAIAYLIKEGLYNL